MPIEWVSGVINIGLVTTESICLIVCRLEGGKAKRISIDNTDGSIYNVYNCLGGTGTSGVSVYDRFGPVNPSSKKQFIVSLFKEDNCPANPNSISTSYQVDPIMEVDFEGSYKKTNGTNVKVLSKTYHFKVSESDHFYITITIEDVGT